MNKTIIIEKIKKKLKDGILLIGLPGIGLIGQISAKYIAKELKAEPIAILLSPYFPHQVMMTKSGTMKLIKNKFYLAKTKKSDLLILVGDIQAISSKGQYEIAGEILQYAKKIGVKKVISIGGYSTGAITEKRRIFGVVTNKKDINELKKLGVVFGEAKGSIVGAAGLLPALSKLYNMDGICLLGETHGGYIDTTSAKEIVKLLSNYLSFEINTKDIEERAKKTEKMIKQLEEEIKKNTEMEEQAKSSVSYIR
ncbi:MAG: proteasome assembly chaperone family protein [Candidatus Pacearchaeota archaeon]